MGERPETAEEIIDNLRAAGYRAYLVGAASEIFSWEQTEGLRHSHLRCPRRFFSSIHGSTNWRALWSFARRWRRGGHLSERVLLSRWAPSRRCPLRNEPNRDAARRDFTINALFLDPDTDEILDFFGGRSDLRDGIIRAIGDPEPRFREDYLRMLRAVRFAARLRFAIEPTTEVAIKIAASITSVSPERVRDELVRILTEGGARRGFELLDELGLLIHLLPEVARMKGVQQPPEFHPEGDVWTHTLIMLEGLEIPSPTLALGVLLHDVGKPPTLSGSPIGSASMGMSRPALRSHANSHAPEVLKR